MFQLFLIKNKKYPLELIGTSHRDIWTSLLPDLIYSGLMTCP